MVSVIVSPFFFYRLLIDRQIVEAIREEAETNALEHGRRKHMMCLRSSCYEGIEKYILYCCIVRTCEESFPRRYMSLHRHR